MLPRSHLKGALLLVKRVIVHIDTAFADHGEGGTPVNGTVAFDDGQRLHCHELVVGRLATGNES